MNVVNARVKDWERRPYKLMADDGYFYGRGTLDDKTGAVAADHLAMGGCLMLPPFRLKNTECGA
jgi:hypothetical protein